MRVGFSRRSCATVGLGSPGEFGKVALTTSSWDREKSSLPLPCSVFWGVGLFFGPAGLLAAAPIVLRAGGSTAAPAPFWFGSSSWMEDQVWWWRDVLRSVGALSCLASNLRDLRPWLQLVLPIMRGGGGYPDARLGGRLTALWSCAGGGVGSFVLLCGASGVLILGGSRRGEIELRKREVEDEDLSDLVIISFLCGVVLVSCSALYCVFPKF